MPSSLKPGDQFTINGCGFGSVNGKVQLNGNFPGGILGLVVKSWTDTTIVAALAADISGVPDQQGVTLEVKTNNNVTSTKPGVQFVALRETRQLTLSDFTTKDYSHGLVKSDVYGNSPMWCSSASVCVKHTVAAVQAIPFHGNDSFQLTLKNGWVYASHEFFDADSGSDVNLFNCPIPSPVAPKPSLIEANTGSPLSFKVRNMFGGCLSWSTYKLKVKVSGPKGMAPT